jgi:hypothetical protein
VLIEKAWILVLAPFLSCAYASIHPGTASRVAGPAPTAQIGVAAPEDGAFAASIYTGTGRFLANRTLSAVREKFPLAQLIEGENEGAALAAAKEQQIEFLVVPRILHWEDRNTPWSGIRDKVQVELRLLKTSPLELISSVRFESRNNSFTFIDGKPEGLLDDDFDEAVLRLF